MSSAHIEGNFLMILAEPTVKNQSGTKTFVAFDTYLLHVIEKCESVVGSVMLDCLNAANIFESTIDTTFAVAEYHEFIEQSHAMPENIKALALTLEFKPEWVAEAHRSTMTKLREALTPVNTTKLSIP